MRRARASVCLGLVGVALALGPAACAGLVGADFGDDHLGTASVGSADGSIQPEPDSSTSPPGNDTGITLGDATIPVIPADGGTCPSGLTNCSGFCVDLANDPDHCGRCTTTCPSDPHGPAVCVASQCAYACESGWLRCAAGCCAVSFPDASGGTDATTGVDSGPGDPGIACASAFCSVAAQDYCCGGSGSGDICVPSTSSDNCPWEITCDNAAECEGGQICCYDNTSNIQQSMCQNSCNGSNQVQFCTTNAECLGGTQCTGTFSASGLQTTYSYCQ